MLLLCLVVGWLVLFLFVFFEGRLDEFCFLVVGLEYYKNYSKEIVKDGFISDKWFVVCYREVVVLNM